MGIKYTIHTKKCDYGEWCEIFNWASSNLLNSSSDYNDNWGDIHPWWTFDNAEDLFFFWIVWK